MTNKSQSALRKWLLISVTLVISPCSVSATQVTSNTSQSTIRVPLEIKTSYLERMLNEWLAGEFPKTEDCRNGDKKLKTCSYTISQSGPANIHTSQDRVALTIPLTAAGRGKYKPTRWSSMSCNLSAHANIEVALSPMIDDQWQIGLVAQVKHDWRSKPTLECGPFKFSVTSKLDRPMTKAGKRMELKLNEPIDIKPRLTELSGELQAPNAIGESPEFFIQFITDQLSYTGLEYNSDSISTLITLAGSLHLSDRSDLVPEKVISFDSPPQLADSGQATRMVINTSINKESIEKKLLDRTNRELSKSNERSFLGFYPQLTFASVSPSNAGMLNLDLEITPYCHSYFGCMDTLTSWFGSIKSQFEFSITEDGVLTFNTAQWVVSETDSLHKKLAKIIIKAGSDLLISNPVTLLQGSDVKQAVGKLLNREVGDWGLLTGALVDVKVAPLTVTDNQLVTQVELIASSKLTTRD